MTFVGNWVTELPQIITAADLYGLDHFFIAAIRHTENGGEGKEFGVLSTSAATYADQLDICCHSVAHRLEQYDKNPLVRYLLTPHPGHLRITYTLAFIQWFGGIWAPPGSRNDPHSLNANWPFNCWSTYQAFLLNGVK